MSSTRGAERKRTPRNRRADVHELRSLRIRTLEHLAYQLKCSVQDLERWAAEPTRFYKCGPRGGLRHAMDNLNTLLQRLLFHDACHGGIKGRSHLTNARAHQNAPLLLKLDIKDFFGNVTTDMVRRAFLKRCGCTPLVAATLARIVTPFGCLPQGSPPSPVIANLAIEPLIRRLDGLAQQHGATLTQYVDDTSLSGPPHLARLQKLCIKIIRDEGFEVRPEKVVAVPRSEEQVVTGAAVNHGLDAPRKLRQELSRACRVRR